MAGGTFNTGVFNNGIFNFPITLDVNVSLEFNGVSDYLENQIRQAQGVANLWTINIWLKPFETQSRFDADGNQLFEPDGKALIHFKGNSHKNEILIWGDRIEGTSRQEFIVVENWDNSRNRIRMTRFNMVQQRQEWRMFSCAWNGDELIGWNNGIEVTDISKTVSGTGSFIMDDVVNFNEGRSIRVGATYSGAEAFNPDSPKLVAYSGLLGPIGVWVDLITTEEFGVVYSGGFNMDLNNVSGSYNSTAELRHWYRPGADIADIGKDYATAAISPVNIGDDATVTSGSIVADVP